MAKTETTEPGGPPMGDLNPNVPPDYGNTDGPDAKKITFESKFSMMLRDYDPSGHDAIHAANAKAVLSRAQSHGLWPVEEAQLVDEQVGDRTVTLIYACKAVKAGSIDPELAVLPGTVAGPDVPILR
jgi:hypothetical protein